MYQAYCDNVLNPMRKLKKIEILGRWVRVMRKVNQKMTVKSNKINIKWIRITSDLIRLNRCRRLFVQRRLGRLAQKVLVLDLFTKQMQRQEKLRMLVHMQLKKYYVQVSLLPRLNLMRLTSRLMHQVAITRIRHFITPR